MQNEMIEGFRLSPQQKSLWLIQQDSTAYRAECVVMIEGNLRVEALKDAVNQIIGRHAIFRTTFQRLAGMKIPFQVIAESAAADWRELDLRATDEREQQIKIKQLFEEERRRPFDFEHGPLLRVSLIALSANKHVLHVMLPSLCADAWTLRNLVDEMARFYKADSQGEETADDEAAQYVQFSEWQNELEEAEDDTAKQARNYWREHDAADGAAPVVVLPFETKSIKQNTFAPESFSISIAPDVSEQMRAVVAEESETTIDVFMLACWQTLLWRLTAESEIVVGTAFDNRKYEELHEAMGLFAVNLPLRSRLDGDLQFSELMRRLERERREASEWQEYFNPEHAAESGETNHNIPINFEYQKRAARQSADGVSFAVTEDYSCASQFKIKLCCADASGNLTAEIHYDPQAYDRETIKRFAGYFERLVGNATANPDKSIGQMEMLSGSERHQLLIEFNDTAATYPRDMCVHELFEEQVKRTPDATAVVFEQKYLSYRDLNQRANRVAHNLIALSVKPEARIGILMNRSIGMVVGLLGILKAGAAYVPLDPTYPQERLGFMLEDAQSPLVITENQFAARLAGRNAAEIVCLNSDGEMLNPSAGASESEENPTSSGATAENLAYVIYTSGSTGKPKGAMIPHRGLVNYLSWCVTAYRVAEGSGAPVHSSISFDLTVTSLFSPLLVGGSVVLVREEEAVLGLATALRANTDFSLVKITPAHLEVLSQSLPAAEADGRTRALIIGGEALFAESLNFWRTSAPGTRLINEYGPTETVVGCAVYEVPKDDVAISGQIPIGRPIANTQIYLLDQHQQPVPVGVSGELHIGGDGLARGYLNRPELTAERFIPNPFSSEPGARLYKTGDMARYLPNGNIEFLGRFDDQVKIRGYRIELGEIEAALGAHKQVRENVVIVREDVPGDKRLVAYYVASPGASLSAGELRSYLQNELPEYMVPSAFVAQDKLPLTVNGKVDRRVLPAPDQVKPELDQDFVLPRNATEEALAGIWADLLRLDRVSIHADFFEQGGHSLLVTQVISRIREALNVELPLRSLFEAPTVAELAGWIEKFSSSTTHGEQLRVPKITRVAREAHRVDVSSGGAMVAPEKEI